MDAESGKIGRQEKRSERGSECGGNEESSVGICVYQHANARIDVFALNMHFN